MQARADIRSYAAEAAAHDHAHHQIVVPWRGRLEMEVEGRGGAVGGATMAVVPTGHVHSFAAAGDNAFLVLDLDGAIELPARGPYVAMHPDLTALCRAVAPHLATSTQTALAARFGALFMTLLADTVATAPVPTAVRRALDLLHRRYGEPLRVEDIAATCGLGRSQLQERFRAVTGTSVHAYLMRIRAEAAMRMLAAGDAPLAEIALATGHGDQSALNRNLRRHAGQSPAAYRRAHRGGGNA